MNNEFRMKQDEMIEDLRKILKYNSVASEPKEGAHNGEVVNECLIEALNIAKGMGFKVKNIDGYAGYAEFGEGDDYVAVLGHLDIVPIGNDWNFDPLGKDIVDGKLYGRGTNDDKGPMMAALHALKSIKDNGDKLGSKVRVIFGTCEETGGPDIEKYLEVEKQPKAGFTPDASFPVINAEKGIINAKITKKLNTGNVEIIELNGGQASNMVPDKAHLKYSIDGKVMEINTKGLSAHGSTPELGDNAIIKLFTQMSELNTELKEEMSFLINALTDTKGKGMGVNLHDEPSGDLSSNFGVCKIENGNLELVINFRVPVTFKENDVKAPLKKFFNENGFEVEFTRFTEPLYYSKDLPLIKTLMDVYKDNTGDKEASPIAIGGGTYAKSMKNVVAFGPGLKGREDVDHIADEYIYIEDYITWAKIYKDAMIKLSFI